MKLKNFFLVLLWAWHCFISFGYCFEGADDAPQEIEDPLESVNRFIFDFNQGVDGVFFEASSQVYESMLPPFLRGRIHDALGNLGQPLVFVNCVLQLEPERAGNALLRFMINTTFGFFGFFDVATEAGLPVIEEDFGKTLEAAGVSSGPYLVLPILGPSSFRDALGILVDFFIDPLYVWASRTNHKRALWVKTGGDLIDKRSYYAESYDEVKRTSLDLYATVRSLYDQKRVNNRGKFSDLPRPSVPVTEERINK